MRQRLITAFLLLALFVPLVLFSTSWLFWAILALVLGLGAWEWWTLAGVPQPLPWTILTLFLFLLLVRLWPRTDTWPAYIALFASAFWLLALMLVLRVAHGETTPSLQALRLSAWPVLVPAFWLAGWLQMRQPVWLLWGLAIIMMTDVLAMLAGKRYGKSKLVPHLSPGKTWAGLWGGLLAGVLVGTLGSGLLISWQAMTCLRGAGLGLVVASSGVVGDLFESLLKRAAGRKDSGQILPGHGGILDRIDAMTAGLPVFVILLYWWGKL